MEKWKDVEGFEGYYQVSDKGNIRSVERVVILKDKLGNDRPSVFKGKLLKNTKKLKIERIGHLDIMFFFVRMEKQKDFMFID